MKHKDVKIGGTYMTRIGMNLCPVIVVSEYIGGSRKAFHVRRVDSNTILPKKRTAAGLRELEKGMVVVMPPVYEEPFGAAGAKDMADDG